MLYEVITALAEQNRLGIAVILHGFMEVQVILRQIREDAYLIAYAVNPIEVQRV